MDVAKAKTASVKDMLKSGMSEDELYEHLKSEIKDAKAAIAAEKERAEKAKVKEDKIAATRMAAIKAVYEHAVALGIIKSNFTDDDFKEIDDYVKDIESDLTRYCNLLGYCAKPHKDKNKDADADDIDNIISDFLKLLE